MEKDYVPFMINKGLSQFADTVLLANQVNQMSHIDKKMQFDFLYNTVKKGKRFGKWHKAESDDVVELLKSCYGYSDTYARSIVDMITPTEIERLKERTNKGGRA
jgi:hypothetical protein